MNDWGVLPEDVYKLIRSREWENHKNFQKRLTGERKFPVIISFKPPTEQQLLTNMLHYQNFISAWKQFAIPELVEWETRNYRSLKNQTIPRRLIISNMQALLKYLGADAVAKSHCWEQRMEPLLVFNKDLYPVLIKHLRTLEALSLCDIDLLVKLLPQLYKGIGAGLYLRALPLTGVDTKFIESFMPLIADLLDVIYQGQIIQTGGLLAWLGCMENPCGWLTVRPLCPDAQVRMGGFSIFQLSVDELRTKALPAINILVVENLQSGLGLTQLENTIAVFGGGRNVSWMNAEWLRGKNLGYWGDIDTWGLAILSEARALAPDLVPLMMDESTLDQFKERMVEETEKYPSIPSHLSKAEVILFKNLQNNIFGNKGRLEQERLSVDYWNQHLEKWIQD
ncbi:MAG: DUF3322 domain-containing protein [Methylococcales bacterium]